MRLSLVLLAVGACARPAACAERPGWDRIEALRADDAFAVPTAPDRAAYAALVADLARAAPSGALPPDAAARAAALHLALAQEGDTVWLTEEPTARHGGGALLLRLGPLPSELVLQAPHPWADKGTGPLVLDLYTAGGVRAALLATANRRAGGPQTEASADPAHNPLLYFQSATLGLADGLARPLVVQLHGYAPETSRADAVVSLGLGRGGGLRLDDVTRQTSLALGAPDAPAVVRTGEDVPELAARTNVQSSALIDRARFLHIELSADQRDALRQDAARQEALRQLLLQLAEGP